MSILSLVPAAASLASSLSASSGSSASSAATRSGSAADSIEQQFLAYAKMSPLDRMRANILHDMNLTEDDVRSMSPQERQRVEDIIKEKVKEQLDKAQAGKGTSTGSADGAAGAARTSPLSSSVLGQMISIQVDQVRKLDPSEIAVKRSMFDRA